MRRFIYILFLVVVVSSCVNESYFGESRQANIIKFSIEGEVSNRIEPLIDWRDVGQVNIVVPESFDLAMLKVTNIECSQLAHFTTKPDTLTNFTKPIELYVVAEDQSVVKKWIVTVTQQQIEKEQLAFSSFTQWYDAKEPNGTLIQIKGKQAYFPGDGSSTSPWQTSAQGNAIALSGLTDFSVFPNTNAKISEWARLVTLRTTSGALMGAGVAAGGLFTGEFVFDVKYVTSERAPRKMINIGVPFYSKPKSVKMEVRYKAGTSMVDGTLQPIKPGEGKPTQDSCDIQVVLQNRLSDPNAWVRVATAALRTPKIGDLNSENGFEAVELPLIYGAPTAEQIAEKPYQRIGGSQGELQYYKFTKNGSVWEVSDKPVTEVYATDLETVTVDNIAVMISCSAYGDMFYAAEGSTLDIRNIELIY